MKWPICRRSSLRKCFWRVKSDEPPHDPDPGTTCLASSFSRRSNVATHPAESASARLARGPFTTKGPPKSLPELDRCFAALLEYLHDRGLLAHTLIMVNNEMGRQPKIGDPRRGAAFIRSCRRLWPVTRLLC